MQCRSASFGPVVLCFFLLAAFAGPVQAQLVVKLAPETVKQFDDYSRKIEAELHQRWDGSRSLLYIENQPDLLKRVLSGELVIEQMAGGKPVEVKDGLIHDWLGAVYIATASAARVIAILQDFDAHKNLYPAVSQSRLIGRSEDGLVGYWRLQQKGIVPVTLDVEQSAHYQQLGPGKWSVRSYAKDIREIDSGLFGSGRKFPPGEGHGYLWRLNSYWTLEDRGGGVLAESRTLSLSRDIPAGLAWAVGPYVQKQPQQSITSTLKATRQAAQRNAAPGK